MNLPSEKDSASKITVDATQHLLTETNDSNNEENILRLDDRPVTAIDPNHMPSETGLLSSIRTEPELATESKKSSNEKDILTLDETPIPAIDPMNMPSEEGSSSRYVMVKNELMTESKKGSNEKDILTRDQTPIAAIDPLDVRTKSSNVKLGKKIELNSIPLQNIAHSPNNAIIEDLNAIPGAYNIPGFGSDRHEDTNTTDISFVATPVANLVSSQRSIVDQIIVAIPIRNTLVNFKDKRVQLACFFIALVIISLSLLLLLNNDTSSRKTPSEPYSKTLTSADVIYPQNNQTNATSDIPTTQSTHFPLSHPSDVPSTYPTYVPSVIPTIDWTLTLSSALKIFAPISSEESLKDKTTPQYLAMDWIVNRDGANMTLREVDKIIERYALAVFYYSTQGENWERQYNFLSDLDVCEWKGYDPFNDWSGVQNCNERGKVISIEFFFENITGTIPSELGSLTELVNLDFAVNNLYGTVPVSLSTIETLSELELFRNDLTGSMENFCTNNVEYSWLSADCLVGSTEKIQCSCCNLCQTRVSAGEK
mmetsp:Transcript_57967/g.67653  ORF Transcript_57967/g.67653 Transcript_57967/m.67653 type:complete len:539 (-) Transcript_57967:534-2150(-)